MVQRACQGQGKVGLCDGCKNMLRRLKGMGMTLALLFVCSNPYSPPRMQPYAFLLL